MTQLKIQPATVLGFFALVVATFGLYRTFQVERNNPASPGKAIEKPAQVVQPAIMQEKPAEKVAASAEQKDGASDAASLPFGTFRLSPAEFPARGLAAHLDFLATGAVDVAYNGGKKRIRFSEYIYRDGKRVKDYSASSSQSVNSPYHSVATFSLKPFYESSNEKGHGLSSVVNFDGGGSRRKLYGPLLEEKETSKAYRVISISSKHKDSEEMAVFVVMRGLDQYYVDTSAPLLDTVKELKPKWAYVLTISFETDDDSSSQQSKEVF